MALDRDLTAPLERRIVTFGRCELRAGDETAAGEKRTLFVGHAAVFNKLSDDLGGFREKIDPGAFADALDGDVRCLLNHDANLLLGRTTSGTLRLSEDKKGLAVENDLPDTSYARDLEVLLERRDLTQMSFGFRVAKDGDSWETGKDGVPIRTLHKVELFDVSPVSFPAYPQTTADVRKRAAEIRAAGAIRKAKPVEDFPIRLEPGCWEAERAETDVRAHLGADEDAIEKCFVVVDDERRYLICDLDDDGEIVADADALAAAARAIASLDEDVTPFKAQLSRWYARMRDELPDFDTLPPWEQTPEPELEERVGKVLSQANHDAIAAAQDALSAAGAALQAVLDAAAPPVEANSPWAATRVFLDELEARGWDDIDDWSIYCLTSMIGLGSSFVVDEDDPADVDAMRQILLQLNAMLGSEIAENPSDEQASAPNPNQEMRAFLDKVEAREWDDIDGYSVWLLTEMIGLGTSFVSGEDDPAAVEMMRAILIQLTGMLTEEVTESPESETNASPFATQRRRLALVEAS